MHPKVNRTRNQFATSARPKHGLHRTASQLVRRARLVANCVVEDPHEVERSVDDPQPIAKKPDGPSFDPDAKELKSDERHVIPLGEAEPGIDSKPCLPPSIGLGHGPEFCMP
jgi:hypothetical protein